MTADKSITKSGLRLLVERSVRRHPSWIPVFYPRRELFKEHDDDDDNDPDLHHFRRVQIREYVEPIHGIGTAMARPRDCFAKGNEEIFESIMQNFAELVSSNFYAAHAAQYPVSITSNLFVRLLLCYFEMLEFPTRTSELLDLQEEVSRDMRSVIDNLEFKY